MKSPQLTLEEQQLIVEALLFAVATDVCAEWNPKQLQQMLEVAKKLNNKDYKLPSIYIFGPSDGDLEEDTQNIVKDFPNLPLNKEFICE